MRKTSKMIVPALLAFGLMAAPVYAEKGWNKEDRREWRKEKRNKMAEELGLNKEQRQQMKEIKKRFRKEGKALREEMKAAGEALRKAMENPDSSEAELRAKHEAMVAVLKKKGDQRFEKMLAIRKILDAEQIKKFAKMHKKRGRKGKQGRGGPGPGGFGGPGFGGPGMEGDGPRGGRPFGRGED